MFRETVTSADGSTETGTASEAQAIGLLRRAVRLGYQIEATRHGGAVITRDIPSAGDTWRPPRQLTVTLEPVTEAGSLTPTMRRDLGMIANGRSPYLATGGPNAGRIVAGLRYAVPPATAARYMARGLVTAGAEDGGRRPVALALVARLAMHARDHRATTSEPRGYVRPADLAYRDAIRAGGTLTLTNYNHSVGLNKPGRRAGKIYDGSSVASCPCRWSWPCGDRDEALRKARGHREDATAGMLRAWLETPERAPA